MAEHPADFPRRELDAQPFLSSPSSSPWSFFPSRGPCSTAFPCVLPCIVPSLLHLLWPRPGICWSLHPLDTGALWLTSLRAEFLLCAARLGCLPALSSTTLHEVPTRKLSVGRAPSCRIFSSLLYAAAFLVSGRTSTSPLTSICPSCRRSTRACPVYFPRSAYSLAGGRAAHSWCPARVHLLCC
ncbi:uncharacterized protein LOC100278027 [Zea mays]|jgi:hypothetical protein|uniref:uncharacterized protein LOC100278027 n=1 Tax=Zea mays TaxID=4577 RepID=UPI000220805C|nr:uncharacterized protein LOC100278027 [Zea mays]